MGCAAKSESLSPGGEYTAMTSSTTAPVVMLESPRFIEEPSLIYYVLRTRPVTVSCRATSAVMVNFKCVDQWVPPAQHVTMDGVERQPPYRRFVQVGIDSLFLFYFTKKYVRKQYKNHATELTKKLTLQYDRPDVKTLCMYTY